MGCAMCRTSWSSAPARSGHTEATVDLCRLAGLSQCGLCCEIMRDDGTMMRTTELLEKRGKGA